MPSRILCDGRAASLVLLLVVATTLVAHAHGRSSAPPLAPAEPTPRIDVVFVLDTTGSMGGLIEGAKQKIWSIAKQMASSQPAPQLRVGLVAYRDRGDAYVTRHFDLDEDIDAVYAELRGYVADGGGDGPESVNQALHEAVTRLDWHPGSDVYKVIFLVGDAPPHMDYANELHYPAIARLAAERGIVVNTIQCGTLGATAEVWRQIAQAGGGEYAAIAQSGGMQVTHTPVDDELAALGRELAETVLPYGGEAEKSELRGKLSRAAAAPPEAAADRLSYLDRAGKRANLGRRDLVEALAVGEVELEELPETALPARLRALEPDAREAAVEAEGRRRAEIQGRIGELVKERDAFLRQQEAERRRAGTEAGFDEKLLETLRRQAGAKGIRYE